VARPSRSGWRVRPPRFGPPPSPSCRLTTSATARCAFWSLMRVAIALVRPRPGRHPVRAAGRLAVPPGRPVPMAPAPRSGTPPPTPAGCSPYRSCWWPSRSPTVTPA
jgi:hypothetical protein